MSDVIIKVPMSGDEYAALLKLSRYECRTPFEHLRWLLKRETARQRGLLHECEEACNAAHA